MFSRFMIETRGSSIIIKNDNLTLLCYNDQMKQIDGFPPYCVDECGNVFSLRYNKIRTLKPNTTKDGYKQVIMKRDGKSVSRFVHRLVALTFLPNPDNLPQVHHIDNNPSNNHLSNLRWVTGSENINEMLISRGSFYIIEVIATGETVRVTNLDKWCRDNGHKNTHLRETYSGRLKSHHGLRIIKKGQVTNPSLICNQQEF